MFVMFPADKNLGPCTIEHDEYIQRALKAHLLDTSTYRKYSRSQALTKIEAIAAILEAFIIKNKDLLQKLDINYLERTKR
jgi:general stress protein CsbA